MSTHNMFLWRTDNYYPSVIIKYPPYLVFWAFHFVAYVNLTDRTDLKYWDRQVWANTADPD